MRTEAAIARLVQDSWCPHKEIGLWPVVHGTGSCPAVGASVYTVYVSTQQRIFQAAKRIFGRDGLNGLSIRNVAKEVGVTPMAIYRHYADKDALIDTLTADALDVWATRVAAIKAHAPMEWLEALTRAFLDFALEEPRNYEAAFVLPARHARRFPDDFVAGHSPAVNMAFARIQQAKAEGLLSDVPVTEITITLWALGQGLVSLYHANRFAGGEREFRTIYAAAMRRCLAYFTNEGTKA